MSFCFAALAAPVHAAGHELSRTEPSTLAVEYAGAVLLASAAQALPFPSRCSWCTPPRFDRWLHSPAGPNSRGPIAAGSHLISFIVLPAGGLSALVLPALLDTGSGRHALENTVLLSEVVVVNFALTLTVKKLAARQRPAFYYARGSSTEFSGTRVEPNLSFFSGDTSLAFSTASGTATLSFLRGYASAPYVTAAGAALAVATGAMRVAADVHWPSDVLMGAVAGTAVGIAVPLLLHGRSSAPEEWAEQGRLRAPLSAPPGALVLGGTF